MLFTELLTKNNLQVTNLSKKLQAMVADYNDIQSIILETEAKLKPGLPEDKNQKLKQDIEDAKSELGELNEEICTGISRWLANHDKNVEKGRAMAAGRAAKKNVAKSTPSKPTVTD